MQDFLVAHEIISNNVINHFQHNPHVYCADQHFFLFHFLFHDSYKVFVTIMLLGMHVCLTKKFFSWFSLTSYLI